MTMERFKTKKEALESGYTTISRGEYFSSNTGRVIQVVDVTVSGYGYDYALVVSNMKLPHCLEKFLAYRSAEIPLQTGVWLTEEKNLVGNLGAASLTCIKEDYLKKCLELAERIELK